MYNSNVTIDLQNNQLEVDLSKTESFKVTLLGTGSLTNTAGRIKRIQKYIRDQTFMLTYGEGVADINIDDLLNFHRDQKKNCNINQNTNTRQIWEY